MEVYVERLCLLLTSLAVSVYGRLGVNVALNRPAFQSSVMEAYYARRANDGNSYDTAMSDLSCAHTEVDTNPWWAVDFGVALYVFGIKFTNRNDFGERSDNFIVGLTNVSPAITAPTLWNYAVCGWVWKSLPGRKMVNREANTFQVGLRLHCMMNCTVSPICDSYNYRPADKTCQFNTHDTQHTPGSCVHTGSGLVLLTRRASLTPTTLHSSPTWLTSSLTATGPGGDQHSAMSPKRHGLLAAT